MTCRVIPESLQSFEIPHVQINTRPRRNSATTLACESGAKAQIVQKSKSCKSANRAKAQIRKVVLTYYNTFLFVRCGAWPAAEALAERRVPLLLHFYYFFIP
jgi:hypothetical protein